MCVKVMSNSAHGGSLWYASPYCEQKAARGGSGGFVGVLAVKSVCAVLPLSLVRLELP